MPKVRFRLPRRLAFYTCDDALTMRTPGKVKPIVDSVYPFEDALKAYERLMTGRATGKVVIKVDPEIAES